MAAIDKIYGNVNQLNEFVDWLWHNNKKATAYLYKWEDEWIYDDKIHPISNFPQKIDKWLLENCPIEWVIDQIKEQYNIKGVVK
jgi:hypothetical protein